MNAKSKTIKFIITAEAIYPLFTLYQGPKIWNSLPILITGSTSFSIFKKKMIEFLMNQVWIDLVALPQQIYEHIANRGGLPYKPGGFLEVSLPSHNC